jgi:long-chain acyl-CoA synthetase
MLTLPEVLRQRAERDGERVMFDFDDRTFTYRDVHAHASEWRARLAAAGVAPDARVALLSGNRPEFVFAVYGALQLGASVVLCSPAWKASEIAHACGIVAPAVE